MVGIDLRLYGRHLAETAAPAIPFVVQSSVSAAAFTAGLAATQLLGYACRVSCATPVLGSAIGFAGVGLASAFAGQASQQCQLYFRGGAPLAAPIGSRQDALVDAVLGVALWKALGGRYRTVLPSDLFAPGAAAVESIPSPGAQYANEVSRGELARLFRRDGCHHCGSKRGPVVGDHIPPNRHVWGSSKEVVPASLQRQLASGIKRLSPKRPPKHNRRARSRAYGGLINRWADRLRSALAIEPAMPSQRYFPQCKACSGKQAAAVKMAKRTLVLHFAGPTAPYFAGVILGLRHFQAVPRPPRGSGLSDPGRRNSSVGRPPILNGPKFLLALDTITGSGLQDVSLRLLEAAHDGASKHESGALPFPATRSSSTAGQREVEGHTDFIWPHSMPCRA